MAKRTRVETKARSVAAPSSALDKPAHANAHARAGGGSLSEIKAANQRAFLEAFRNCGIIKLACAAADVARSTIDLWRKDSEFEAEFRDALDEAVDRIEEEAHRRAVDGWDEPVFGQAQEVVELGEGKTKVVTVTKEVGVIRRYSDRLLERLLIGNRPEKYNRTRLEHTGKDGEPLTLDPSKLNDDQLRALAELVGGLGGQR